MQYLCRVAAILAAVSAVAPAATGAPPAVKVATPAELFERAKNAYTFGDYAQAVRLFDGLLNPKVLLAETRDIEEALELLGIGAFYEGDRGRSREAFLRLLSLHPEHQLDPLLVRPEVVSFFSAISTELADRLDELRKRREVQAAWEAEQRRRSGPVVVRRELETPRWLGVVPFGVPQYLRDDVAWGTVFATGQALTALASVVAFSWSGGRVPRGAGAPRRRRPGLRDRPRSSRGRAGANGPVDGRGIPRTRRVGHRRRTAAVEGIDPPRRGDEDLDSRSEATPAGGAEAPDRGEQRGARGRRVGPPSLE